MAIVGQDYRVGGLVDVPGLGYLPSPLAPDAVPDLADPVTLGWLRSFVREAYNQPSAYTEPDFWLSAFEAYGWRCWLSDAHFEGRTEAEALVAALEAAP